MTDQRKKVSIQGYRGSFHHIAAESLLHLDTDIQERDYFPEVFRDVSEGLVDAGVVAVCNSLFGEIIEVSQLLQSHPELKIVKKLELPIQQNLVVIPGTTLSDLKEIHSQLPALEQCSIFFDNHRELKKVETSDTALSVLKMMQRQEKKIGAVSSLLAAKLYGAEVLIPSIQNSEENITTFVLFTRK